MSGVEHVTGDGVGIPGTVALVHDFLVERGGAERVLIELARAFPGAPVYTALFHPSRTFPELSEVAVHPLVRDRWNLFGAQHRCSLLWALRALRRTVIEADLVFCSTSGLSHLPTVHGRKVVYCHTPARWLHQPEVYFRRLGRLQPVTTAALAAFRAADAAAMRSADLVLVNSSVTARAVEALYGVDALVVPPASSFTTTGPTCGIPGVQPGFVLTPSRLLAYKRLDVLLDAARLQPRIRFVVVGAGPSHRWLAHHAPPNVALVGAVTDEQLRWAYANCTAVALTCADDYGLVPSEAASFGKPAVVPDSGGYSEQDLDDRGARYRFGDAAHLVSVLEQLRTWTPPEAPPDVGGLARAAFRGELRRVAADLLPPRARSLT